MLHRGSMGKMGWLSDTWDSVKENANDICHGVLDAAGFIPAVGAVPDLINAGIYAAEGNTVEAGLSLVAAIPVVGDIGAGVGKGGKWFSKAGKWFLETKAGKRVVPQLLSALERCKFLAGKFAEFCKTRWGKIKTGAKGFFNGGKNFFKKIIEKIKNWFKKIRDKFKRKGKGESGSTRPSWRQSELDAAKDFPEYAEQKSFINGQEVPYGTKGSVRPDLYKDGSSIDVKNYGIETASGRNNLARNIEKQYHQRVTNLPNGTKQSVLIDIRGQNVLDTDLTSLYNDIMRRTNNGITIKFKTN